MQDAGSLSPCERMSFARLDDNVLLEIMEYLPVCDMRFVLLLRARATGLPSGPDSQFGRALRGMIRARPSRLHGAIADLERKYRDNIIQIYSWIRTGDDTYATPEHRAYGEVAMRMASARVRDHEERYGVSSVAYDNLVECKAKALRTEWSVEHDTRRLLDAEMLRVPESLHQLGLLYGVLVHTGPPCLTFPKNARPVATGYDTESAADHARAWDKRACPRSIHTHCLADGLYPRGRVQPNQRTFVCMSRDHTAMECCACRCATPTPFDILHDHVRSFPFHGHKQGDWERA
jgi:hypothetical protein